VAESNQELDGNPQLVNESPEEEGWVCKLKNVDASELDDLMEEKDYRVYVASL
jgi:glycine cleavage system H protein